MHTKSQQCVAGKFCAVLIPFLRRRTEVPQCFGQACFDREREERRNTEKDRKESGQESSETGVSVDFMQYNEETDRGMKTNSRSQEKKVSVFL